MSRSLVLRAAIVTGLVATSATIVGACGGSGGTGTSGFGGMSGGTQSNGTASMSGENSGAMSIGSGFATGSATSTGSGEGGGCAGQATKAQAIPLDMFIMLDQSGSMSDPVNDPNNPAATKWTAVTGALSAFVTQPGSAGIGVGLQYFGLPPAGCKELCSTDNDCAGCDFPSCGGFGAPGMCGWFDDTCNAVDYAKAEVPIALLPGNAGAITMSLAKHAPYTITPTAPALQGAIDFVRQYQTANPTHVVVNVFATDGDPSECAPLDSTLAIGSPNDPPGRYDSPANYTAMTVASIAAGGAQGMPKVLTFVIGVGNSTMSLDTIAAAGGTMSAFIVDTNANATQQFLDALNKIRGTALACSYLIPLPEAGTPDYSKVNVEYTPGNGGMTVTIPKVNDKASCPMNGDGWYYDDNQNPTTIIMCDSTCTKLSMDAKGEVNIVLGCKTVIN